MLAWYQKKRKKAALCYLAVYVISCYAMLLSYIPQEITITQGESDISIAAPVSITEEYEDQIVPTEGVKTASGVKKTYCCRLFGVLPVATVQGTLVKEQSVDVVGEPVGIYLKTNGIYVAGLKEVRGQQGESVSPCAYVLQEGDYILSANEKELLSKEELQKVVADSEGKPIELVVNRSGENTKVRVQAIQTEDGDYKLGIWVKDDVAGVGTLTYVKEDGTYGALGHGIQASSAGNVLRLKEGYLYNANITDITPSSIGSPGEISGLIHYGEGDRLGTIQLNTSEGIHGKLTNVAATEFSGTAYPVAYKQEIRREQANILFGESDKVRGYGIVIDQIDYDAKETNKSFVFHVTDEALIEKTGGIVQGMSGSPIIQNGKIIGAVTHVFVNDPTKGYGIFIENMLEH